MTRNAVNEVTVQQSARLPEAECANLFAVPLLSHVWPDSVDLNDALQRVILARREQTAGMQVTNAGGWHSKRDLASWPEGSVAELVRRIHVMVCEMVHRTVSDPQPEHLRDWTIEAWANVNVRGNYNKAHVHTRGGNLWSGVYYVARGDDGLERPFTGLTRFQDRSGVPKETIRTADPFEREHVIPPQPGLMVMFPGTLYHSVDPLLSPGPRITVAFNLSHPGFTIPKYEPDTWMWTNFRGVMKLREKAVQWLSGGGGFRR